MANDKMNQFLRDRKIKHRKVAGYRKQRIVKQYRKMQEDAPENDRTVEIDPQDEGAQRRIQYYKQVFSAPPAEAVPVPKAAPIAPPVPQVDPSIAKLSQLKHKKQKYIRKMQKEKTSKGQPIMRNYIKYALSKLEETLEREKKEKQRQKK